MRGGGRVDVNHLSVILSEMRTWNGGHAKNRWRRTKNWLSVERGKMAELAKTIDQFKRSSCQKPDA
jgi:hypothetical protein